MTTLYHVVLALIIFGCGFKIGTAIMREKLEEANEEWFKISEGWRELCTERAETIEELMAEKEKLADLSPQEVKAVHAYIEKLKAKREGE